ncbi:hypothetical protein M436DRAFT_61229 [Aureobasidium namibiae CBS 147.97]|uniref:Uncharacterized protein n=1 Tax=Aureobasidium namibiae CBS 147.97 TaxID=1043004 RepID=A0A074XMY6_9PEZI|nr:uncharacterized protein M436DRAFT_61229 [Aureobasidium namibiae CBS 147.97]KEQ75931.1 hypothetical protein M436DRAFT_61229 [Aureobasidium namibiae CBS 147.97]
MISVPKNCETITGFDRLRVFSSPLLSFFPPTITTLFPPIHIQSPSLTSKLYIAYALNSAGSESLDLVVLSLVSSKATKSNFLAQSSFNTVDAQRVQGRQHEKLFEMLNDLHYFSGVRTRDDMRGELQEHTRLMGSIMNLPADRIAAQTDHQKRMLQVVVFDSPPMKAKDSKSRCLAHLAILDIVNDEREGFMQDKERCCLAFGCAKEQMIVITGTLAKVRDDATTQVVKDATDGDNVKTITLSRPLLHWAHLFVNIGCQFSCVPPEFDIPADLAFYGQAE